MKRIDILETDIQLSMLKSLPGHNSSVGHTRLGKHHMGSGREAQTLGWE